jgi:uncharacterized Zn finger protein
MEANLKQLRCGSCGELDHRLYTNPKGEVFVECLKCKNVSIISCTEPKIIINNHSGDGCLAVF